MQVTVVAQDQMNMASTLDLINKKADLMIDGLLKSTPFDPHPSIG
jgi:hypothetical protein